jgi:hypothetical protein
MQAFFIASCNMQEREALNQHRFLAPRPLDTLRLALCDEQSSVDMNNSPFRHVMVISETLTGLDILMEELRRTGADPVMLYVSSFQGTQKKHACWCTFRSTRASPFLGLVLLLRCHDVCVPGDATDIRHSDLEAQLKTAIELGRTVVLVNASSMYSALYDVLVCGVAPVARPSSTQARCCGLKRTLQSTTFVFCSNPLSSPLLSSPLLSPPPSRTSTTPA